VLEEANDSDYAARAMPTPVRGKGGMRMSDANIDA